MSGRGAWRAGPQGCRTFHIGFIQPSETAVDEVNERLRDDGFDIEPPSRQHGAWTFYFEAPGGFTIEVLC